MLKSDFQNAVKWWRDLHWAIRIPATVGLFFLLFGAVIYAISRVTVCAGLATYLRTRGFGFLESFRAITDRANVERQRALRREEYRGVVRKLKAELKELEREEKESTEREENAKRKIEACGDDADCSDFEFERYRKRFDRDED